MGEGVGGEGREVRWDRAARALSSASTRGKEGEGENCRSDGEQEGGWGRGFGPGLELLLPGWGGGGLPGSEGGAGGEGKEGSDRALSSASWPETWAPCTINLNR